MYFSLCTPLSCLVVHSTLVVHTWCLWRWCGPHRCSHTILGGKEYLKDSRVSRKKCLTLIADPQVLRERARKIATDLSTYQMSTSAHATPFSSDNHQLWRRYQHHQPAPGRWNTTSEADPASWHGQEGASMPRRHPSEPSWHRHSDHGYPIGVYLNSSKLFSRFFSEPPLWQEIIQWLAIIKFGVPFSQSHDVNIYTCYSYVQVYKDQQCTPEPIVTRWSKSLVSMCIHSVWMIYTCYEFIHIWKETSNTPQSQT